MGKIALYPKNTNKYAYKAVCFISLQDCLLLWAGATCILMLLQLCSFDFKAVFLQELLGECA